METKDKIIEEIKKIYDPELPVNIYDLGLIYEVRVNDKKVNIPSYILRVGDKITVRDKSKELEAFVMAQQVAKTPDYVTANDKNLTAELNRIPNADEVPVTCEISLVVEFYAR